MTKTKTPPSQRRALQYANAAADAHHNASRMRAVLGNRLEKNHRGNFAWSTRDILKTGITRRHE